jgi:outer membrane protein
MTLKTKFPTLFFFLFLGISLILSDSASAQEPAKVFNLEQTITDALAANIEIQSSKEGTKAASAVQKARRTNFFPTFNASYQYSRNDDAVSIGGFVQSPKEEYMFATTVTQPIFTGFSNLNSYKVAKLGLDVAEINEKQVRQNIILKAKQVYFSLLRTQKLLNIAEDTVKLIEAHKNVAKNFYEVGMTPLNDLLQSEVELANAKQDFIVVRNNFENAESNFNTLLRRPLNTPVAVEDILEYAPFEQKLDDCIAEAEKNRPELKIAGLEIEIAEKEVSLAKKNYFPSINLQGTYFNNGTDWNVDGGDGIYDPSGWNILATASWNFWEWGRTSYGIKEKLSRLSQAKLKKTDIYDNMLLEVKNAYLRTQEAEQAIITVEKAIEQAKENLRINQERYQEQMATSTDVLDAQTLLSRTMTNYYNALYAFKLSKAALYRAIGRETME